MVSTNSQHQRSSISGHLAIHPIARAAMSLLDESTAAAAPACVEPAGEGDGRRSDDDVGEPTATQVPAPARGDAANIAEAANLAPAGQPGSSSDLTATNEEEVTAKGRSIVEEINALKAEQKAAREQKKKISKDLRNAEKRRQRLKKRAKQLSDADLVAVMSLRVHEKALLGKATAGGVSTGLDEEASDSGSVTSTTTAGAASASSSPMLQPTKRNRAA